MLRLLSLLFALWLAVQLSRLLRDHGAVLGWSERVCMFCSRWSVVRRLSALVLASAFVGAWYLAAAHQYWGWGTKCWVWWESRTTTTSTRQGRRAGGSSKAERNIPTTRIGGKKKIRRRRQQPKPEDVEDQNPQRAEEPQAKNEAGTNAMYSALTLLWRLVMKAASKLCEASNAVWNAVWNYYTYRLAAVGQREEQARQTREECLFDGAIVDTRDAGRATESSGGDVDSDTDDELDEFDDID